MADQEQLDLIKQGVEVWNSWRKHHPNTKVDLSGADLSETDLSGVDLSGGDLYDTDFREAYLNNSFLRDADLREAHLREAHLNKAILIDTNLIGADLRGTNLFEADLGGANLSLTNLFGANLSYANLGYADLSYADLSHADFSHALIEGTIFGDVDLRSVKGLETVEHVGPSTIGTNTLLCSEGSVPEIFLRGAGLNDSFIEYIRSLRQRPIEYYTCFISYSSKDHEFAERLYADLQNNNVRCWYAPEDMKIGDKIRQRIDESIRMYDKLLLVLSQHSVMSSWVEKEVETAFEKERRHNKLVLFPIMLDDAVMRTTQAWAADISRTRHIGDFTCWKVHDAYQRGLKRLLRDLKAGSTMREI